MNKIISILKADGNWADRERKILDKRNKSAVNNNTVSNIVKNHDYLVNQDLFNEKLRELSRLRSSNTECRYQFVDIKLVNSLENIEKILNTVLEKKNSGQLAEEIYYVLDRHGTTWVEEISNVMKSDIEYCPYCFQKLDSNYKQHVVNEIKNVISKDEDELIFKIKQNILQTYEIDELPEFISDTDKRNFEKIVKEYNNQVESINTLLLKKKDKLYTKIILPENSFMVAQNNLYSKIDELKKLIDKHNNDIKKVNIIEKELQNYNNALAWETIKDDYNNYLNNQNLQKFESNKVNDLNQKISTLKNTINELEATKKNVDDAVKEINDSLNFIFMTSKRLQIRNEGNKYILFSNGKPVESKYLSSGERNIISLCYFFSCIGAGKSTNERFNDEYIICIDDPISSFDHENIIGIYSYLRKSIYSILSGNVMTRFIFFTHDYEVAYNLDKILQDVCEELPKINGKIKLKNSRIDNFKLSGDGEENFSLGKNQYYKLMHSIYEYATGDDKNISDLTIGNSIRRLLETFSSFEFCKKMESLNKMLDVKEDNLNYDIMKNYMYRVVINNESHGKIAAYAYDEINKFETFTTEEKRNTAKMALLILKNINPKHIEAYFENDKEKLNKMQEWEDDLLKK